MLSNINLKVRGGEAVALLGSTGSGKTTLVNLLPRFYEYTDGSIKLDGVELTDYPRTYLRSQIGIVEQEPFLFSKTIKENIKIGVDRPVSDDEVIAAAKAAAIHDSIMTFPDGYDTLVGERGVTLSGGQKQRVAIARTLLKNPRILILDDSTSSVDMETEAEIRAALETLMEGRTTFIIAHRVQSLMNADQIVVLDKGKIVQHGTHETLLQEEGLVPPDLRPAGQGRRGAPGRADGGSHELVEREELQESYQFRQFVSFGNSGPPWGFRWQTITNSKKKSSAPNSTAGRCAGSWGWCGRTGSGSSGS